MPNILTIPEKSKEPVIDIALNTIEMDKQALIFASTKRGAEKTAEDIADPEKILSEGEKRAVALADFLTENSLEFRMQGLKSAYLTGGVLVI